MKENETPKRAYFHYGSSWYARPGNLVEGALDTVTFGPFYEDGSGDGDSANMVWYSLGPRLEVSCDGWAELATMGDVLTALAALDRPVFPNLKPLHFCMMLESLGFTNRTITTKPAHSCDNPPETAPRAPIYYLNIASTHADFKPGWYIGQVVRVGTDVARVAFDLPVGAVHETDVPILELWGYLPDGAVLVNDAETVDHAFDMVYATERDAAQTALARHMRGTEHAL